MDFAKGLDFLLEFAYIFRVLFSGRIYANPDFIGIEMKGL